MSKLLELGIISVNTEPMAFSYLRYNATRALINVFGSNWQQIILEEGKSEDVLHKNLAATPHITKDDTPEVWLGRVEGDVTKAQLPGLHTIFRGPFLTAARELDPTAVITTDERKIGVLNVQNNSGEKMTGHVDSNPVTGLLFVTTHPEGEGALVVANFQGLVTPTEVYDSGDYTRIQPRAGDIIVFGAQNNTHFTETVSEGELRVVTLSNYYTDSSPEEPNSTLQVSLNAARFRNTN